MQQPGQSQILSKESFVSRVEWEPHMISASAVINSEEHNVWIAANEDLFQETDFLLPIMLLPAMQAGTALKLPGKVSPQLLSSTPQIQDIFSMWESLYKRVPVEVETRSNPVAAVGSGVGCFFSGGIDSFYTLLKHREEISHLIYILYLSTDQHSIVEGNAPGVRETARELGKSVIEVKTNLPAFADQRRISWNPYYQGMWIVSAALLFQHMFHRMLIAGSGRSNYDTLRPQGNHPILDPLWSTELMNFYHDGCEARRGDKAAYIADYEVAMKHLQVCDHTGENFNCGRCSKCLRSMINLKAAGVLERCETLPHEIDPEAVLALDLSEYTESYLARQNLRALERREAEPELVRALKEALDRGGQIIDHSGYKEERLDHLYNRLQRQKQRIHTQKQRLQTKRNRAAQLRARASSRHYRLADTAKRIVLRVPGAARLLKKRRT